VAVLLAFDLLVGGAMLGLHSRDRVEALRASTCVPSPAGTASTSSTRPVRSSARPTPGGASGSSDIESWAHRETGLTLKRISVLDGSEDGPGGKVRYHEEYTLVLQSLEPRR
jgi:hypothetical protein